MRRHAFQVLISRKSSTAVLVKWAATWRWTLAMLCSMAMWNYGYIHHWNPCITKMGISMLQSGDLWWLNRQRCGAILRSWGFSHCLSRISLVHRSIVWGVVHLSTTNNLTNKVAGNHEKVLGGVYSQQMPTVYIYNLSLSKHKQFLGIRKFQGEHYIFSQPWDLGDSCPIFRAISGDIRTYSMFPCLAYVLTQPWHIPSRPFPHLRFSLHLKAQTPQLAQA